MKDTPKVSSRSRPPRLGSCEEFVDNQEKVGRMFCPILCTLNVFSKQFSSFHHAAYLAGGEY